MLLLIFYVDVILLFLSTTSNSGSRKVYLPDPDPTVMEEWAKEVGRTKSEVKEDEDHC